jgi:1-acyl-sn-glycerol-3-phosphate acyltransferase
VSLAAETLGSALIGATRFLVGGRARWIGSRPDSVQRIYFANHASHMDALVLWAALPAELRRTTKPVAAADYWGRDPWRRRLAEEVLGAVLIERGTGAEALVPLAAALREGASLIVFPEGTRNPEPLPGPFKAGLYFLARDFSGVELVPVYLDNLNRALPKGVLLPVPVSSAALFGAPMAVEPSEEKAEFLARAQAAVTALGRLQHPEVADG